MNIFEQSFDRTIWQQFVDSRSALLLLELRDSSNRSLSYVVFDLNTRKVLHDFVPTHDDWWSKIVLFQDQKIVFTTFKEDSPEITGTYITDLAGKILWSNSKSYPIITNQEIQLFDLNGQKQALPESHNSFAISSPNLLEPVPYLFETDHFNTVAAFLKDTLHVQPIEAIEYLEYNEKIIIGFHILIENRLENSIIVLNNDGNILFQDIISTGRKGIGFGTFYVYKDHCIYIKELECLKIIAL